MRRSGHLHAVLVHTSSYTTVINTTSITSANIRSEKTPEFNRVKSNYAPLPDGHSAGLQFAPRWIRTTITKYKIKIVNSI